MAQQEKLLSEAEISLHFVFDFTIFGLGILAQTVQESHVPTSLVFYYVISEDEVAGFPGLLSEYVESSRTNQCLEIAGLRHQLKKN